MQRCYLNLQPTPQIPPGRRVVVPFNPAIAGDVSQAGVVGVRGKRPDTITNLKQVRQADRPVLVHVAGHDVEGEDEVAAGDAVAGDSADAVGPLAVERQASIT